MNKRDAFAFLTIGLLAGCGIVDGSKSDPSPLSFEIREGNYFGPPQPQIGLIVSTEKQYPCMNYQLDGILGVAPPTFRVDFLGTVSIGQICLTAIGPAQFKTALPVTNGTYTLELRRNDVTDRYRIIVSTNAIDVVTLQAHFTHPTEDPSGATYNVAQSINAVGAGGFRGRGVAGSTQTNSHFLPEHATDFAFASLAEQRGFLGVSILLLLYLLVVWRGLKIVAVARDAFSAIAAGGIVVAFLFQIFVNVGMAIGIAPVTGIPLPFVSAGGSAMIANLLAIGVLEAIHARGTGSRRRLLR